MVFRWISSAAGELAARMPLARRAPELGGEWVGAGQPRIAQHPPVCFPDALTPDPLYVPWDG